MLICSNEKIFVQFTFSFIFTMIKDDVYIFPSCVIEFSFIKLSLDVSMTPKFFAAFPKYLLSVNIFLNNNSFLH